MQVADLADLKRLLVEHPEWRDELRPLLLTQDFLALPSIVTDLAAAQRRTEACLQELTAAQQRTEARLQELAAAQQRTEARLQELAAAQQRTELRLEELAAAQQRTELRLEELVARVADLALAQERTERTLQHVADRGDRTWGHVLADRYAQRAPAYFGRMLHRLRVIIPGRLDPAVEDALQRGLHPDECAEVYLLDVLARGRLALAKEGEPQEAWIAVEVSAVVDENDVERAIRRAGLLRKAGLPALAVVAGESATGGARSAARGRPVVFVLDGTSEGWEEAIATLQAEPLPRAPSK